MASLTGWKLADVRERMVKSGQVVLPAGASGDDKSWYQQMWGKGQK